MVGRVLIDRQVVKREGPMARSWPSRSLQWMSCHCSAFQFNVIGVQIALGESQRLVQALLQEIAGGQSADHSRLRASFSPIVVFRQMKQSHPLSARLPD
jgi:hypothetical protein